MTWLRHARDRRLRGDEGLTLVELLVAMMILGIVMTVMTSVLISIQRAVVTQDNRSTNLNQARLALQTIDRQVRSGNLLYNPNIESPAYFQIRIYTQSNAPTYGAARCVVWQINSSEQLITRSWPANQPDLATGWYIAATGVVNRDVSPSVNAFTLASTNRTISLTFLVNADLTHYPNSTQYLRASLTGRNTSFGYPFDVCEDLPS
jgi:prepilin-type N-terminal cleavage/methylation domain-containing protein